MGGQPFSSVAHRAPIELSGTVTRRIGLADSDSSPTSFEAKLCADKMPAINRIAVPALPISKSCCGSCNPCMPTPVIDKRPSTGPSAETPIALNAFNVAITSCPSSNPVMLLTPFANEENITAR